MIKCIQSFIFRSILIVLSAPLAICGHSQVEFIRTYSLPSNSEVKNFDVHPNGDMLIPCTHSSTGQIMRLDQIGDQIWDRDYSTIGYFDSGTPGSPWPSTQFNDVVAMPNGGFAAVGWADQGGWPASEYVYTLFDDQGDEIWSKAIGDNWSQWLLEVDLLSTQQLVAFGATGSISSVTSRVLIIDLATGSMTHHRRLGTGYGQIFDMSLSNDGNVLASGGYDMNSAFYISKLDQDLLPIWESAWSTFEPRMLTGSVDGATYAANEDILTRIDPTGMVVWSLELAMGSGNEFTVLLARPNNKVLAAGKNNAGYAWLAQIDTLGNVDWIRQFGDVGYDYHISDLHEMSDGSLKMVGMAAGDLLVISCSDSGTVSTCPYPDPLLLLNPVGLNPSTAFPSSAQPVWNGLDVSVSHDAVYSTDQFVCEPQDLYRAIGSSFIDVNNDGLLDINDVPLPFAPVLVQPGNEQIFGSFTGQYTISRLQPDTIIIEPILPSSLWQLSTDSTSFTVPFSMNDSLFEDLDIGFTPAIYQDVLEGSYVPQSGPCGLLTLQHVHVLNLGTTTPQGVAELILDTLYTFINSTPMPDSIVDDHLFWSFDSISWAGQWEQEFSALTPLALFLGDTTKTTLVIHADDGFGNLTEVDTTIWLDAVSCAYDPNDKHVDPVGYGLYGALPITTEDLTYTIRFQNTGTDTAYNVSIMDQIDPSLDPSSVHVLASSHLLSELNVNGPTVNFMFENILLPDSGTDLSGSQGYVVFRINTANGLSHLDEANNNAGIIFDLNDPVITNTERNTFVDCATVDFQANVQQGGPSDLYIWTFWDDTMTYSYQWFQDGQSILGETGSFILNVVPGNYHCVLTDVYGCTDLSDTLAILPTHVPNNSAEPFIQVFPNPFNETTRIVLSEPLGSNERLEVIDIHGRTLRTIQGTGDNEYILVRQDLRSGIYVLKYQPRGQWPVSLRMVVD